MKKLMPIKTGQEGFIPLMICVLTVIAGVIYLCYRLVANAHQ
jgi:hypothetical protein